METHNVSIYHCITCGRIVHTEVSAVPPQCCGQAMSPASEDTLLQGEPAGETPGGQSAPAATTANGSEKPR